MSESSRHRIAQLEVELEVTGGAPARAQARGQALQEAVSQLVRRQLRGVIDRVASEASKGQRLRIDRLELDLGRLPEGDFEAAFVRAFEAALRRALGDAAARERAERASTGEGSAAALTQPGSALASAWEIVEVYAWTGQLPWWAERGAPDLVARSLALLADAPDPRVRAQLGGLVLELARRPWTLARLVRASLASRAVGAPGASPRSLLLVRRDGPQAALVEAVVALSLEAAGVSARTRASVVEAVWLRVVEEAARGHLSGPEAEGVVRRSLDMVADVVAAHGLLGRAALGAAVVEGVFGAGAAEAEGALSSTTTEAAALLSALDWARVSPELGARASRAVRARERTAAEAQGVGATEASAPTGTTEPTAPVAGEELRRRREEDAPVQGVSAALRRLVRALVDGHAASADSEGSEASALPALPPAGAQPEALQRSILELGRALLAQRPTPAALRGQLEWLASPAAAELPQPWREALLVELNASLSSAAGSRAAGSGPATPTRRPALDRREPEAPEPARRVPPRGLAELLDQGGLAVEDAGLVMLWPFLERLFQRLELVDPEPRTFPHLRAQTRGARLLHALARGPAAYAEDPPEFTMTLPKLLCGLEPDAPLDPDGLAEALPATFLDEGERLLEAVLGHAEGLGLRGVDGLRGSFLLRDGVLVSRDGAWLLRVAGEAYDLLLARVPWSWSWVSLPWMAEPLRVEW